MEVDVKLSWKEHIICFLISFAAFICFITIYKLIFGTLTNNFIN